MTLIDPGTQTNFQRINSRNLEKVTELATGGAKDQVVPLTQLALDCFKDIEDRRLGPWHQVRKYAVGTVAFTAAVGIPLGVSVACGWIYLYRNTPSLLGLSITAGSALLVDRTSKTLTNFAPLKFLATVAVATIIYGATKVTEAAVGSYSAMEEETGEFTKNRHEQILKSLTDTYNGVADELKSAFEKHQESPKELYKLQQTAEAVDSVLQLAEEKMATIGLSPSEASQVMNQLHAVVRLISEYRITLKSDAAYNIKLLTGLPDEAFGAVCVPDSVHKHIESAKANQLGYGHTAKKIANTILGSTATLSVNIACGIASQSIKQIEALGVWPQIAFGASGLTLSGFVGKHLFSSYSQVASKAEATVTGEYSLAKDELTQVYTTITSHLEAELAKVRPTRNKRKRTIPEELADASKLQERLPVIKQQIDALHIPGCTGEEVTSKLAGVLSNIAAAFQ